MQPARAGSFLLGASLFLWVHVRVTREPFPGSPAAHDLLVYACEVLAAGLAGWGLWRGQGRPGPLLLAGAALWLVAAGAGSAAASDPILASSWTLALALALACVVAGVDRPALRTGLAVGVAVSLPIMLYQAVAQTTWPAGTLNGWPGELTGAIRGTAVLGAERWLRPYGLTLHPNIAGGFAAVCCMLFAWAWLRQRDRWQLALTSTAFAEVLLSFSRSAWLGALLGLAGLALLIHENRRALLIALAIPTAVFVVALGPLVLQRAEASGQLEADSISQRVYLAGTAIRFWREQPLLGIGPEQFSQREVDAYGASFRPEPVHNGPLLVLAETGLTGFAGAALMAAGIGLSILRGHDWERGAAGLALLPPLLLDHYLLTSTMGLILAGVAIAPGAMPNKRGEPAAR